MGDRDRRAEKTGWVRPRKVEGADQSKKLDEGAFRVEVEGWPGRSMDPLAKKGTPAGALSDSKRMTYRGPL
jgi:hypothetical protein